MYIVKIYIHTYRLILCVYKYIHTNEHSLHIYWFTYKCGYGMLRMCCTQHLALLLAMCVFQCAFWRDSKRNVQMFYTQESIAQMRQFLPIGVGSVFSVFCPFPLYPTTNTHPHKHIRTYLFPLLYKLNRRHTRTHYSS